MHFASLLAAKDARAEARATGASRGEFSMVTAVNKIFDSIKRGWDSPVHITPSFARECDDEAPTKERPIAAHVNSLHMRTGSCSVTGNYRQLNEDRCFTDDENHLLLIVDGMGGHRGG